MKATQDKLNEYKAYYNYLRNHPQIKVEKEIEYKDVPTIDNRVRVFIIFSVILQFIAAAVHLCLSGYMEHLVKDFLYDIKSVFNWVTSDWYSITISVLIIMLIIIPIIYFNSKYKEYDGVIGIFYLITISSVVAIIEEPIIALCFRISYLMGYKELVFHPFFLWLILMLLTYIIYSCVMLHINKKQANKQNQIFY